MCVMHSLRLSPPPPPSVFSVSCRSRRSVFVPGRVDGPGRAALVCLSRGSSRSYSRYSIRSGPNQGRGTCGIGPGRPSSGRARHSTDSERSYRTLSVLTIWSSLPKLCTDPTGRNIFQRNNIHSTPPHDGSYLCSFGKVIVPPVTRNIYL